MTATSKSASSDVMDVVRALRAADKLLLICHVGPDGDTLGSALGLAWALRRLGKTVRVSCADPVPASLMFLPGAGGISPRTLSDEDCVVAVDASDEERLGNVYARERFCHVPLVVIDHHVTNTQYGDANYVQLTSSTAELILEVVQALDLAVDATVATCLLTGLVTDTQSFRTTSTTADSLRAAVRLVEAGGDLHRVMDAAFRQRSVPSLALWGRALTHVQCDEGIVWAVVSQEMLRAIGAGNEMVSGLVSFLSSVAEARIAVVFHQVDERHIEVGLRSVPGVDVSEVAVHFGGGGHAQASGFTVSGDVIEVVGDVLAALRQTLEHAVHEAAVGSLAAVGSGASATDS